jgi:hypothetical protein
MNPLNALAAAVQKARNRGETVTRVVLSKSKINALTVEMGLEPYIPQIADAQTQEFVEHDRHGHAFNIMGLAIYYDCKLPDGEMRLERGDEPLTMLSDDPDGLWAQLRESYREEDGGAE